MFEINYELLQEELKECDQELQNKAQEDRLIEMRSETQEDGFVEIQKDEIKEAESQESNFKKMQLKYGIDLAYHHPSAILLLNVGKTVKGCAESAYGTAKCLDDSQPIKVENATFTSGVENIISGGAGVLNRVYGISCNPYKVTYDLVNGNDTLNDIKKSTSKVLLGVGHVASSISSVINDVAVNCVSGLTPKSTLSSVFYTAWQYLGVAV